MGSLFIKFNVRIAVYREKGPLKQWPVMEVIVISAVTAIISFLVSTPIRGPSVGTNTVFLGPLHEVSLNASEGRAHPLISNPGYRHPILWPTSSRTVTQMSITMVYASQYKSSHVSNLSLTWRIVQISSGPRRSF